MFCRVDYYDEINVEKIRDDCNRELYLEEGVHAMNDARESESRSTSGIWTQIHIPATQ